VSECFFFCFFFYRCSPTPRAVKRLCIIVTFSDLVGLSLWFQTRIRWEINLKLGHSHSDQTSVLDVCYFKLFFISGDHLHGEVGNIDFRFGWRRGVVVSGVRQ